MVSCLPTDKPAWLSSLYREDTTADEAVDGIYVIEPPIDEAVSIAHSQEQINPWWRVNLQEIHCIIAVNITNRISKFAQCMV